MKIYKCKSILGLHIPTAEIAEIEVKNYFDAESKFFHYLRKQVMPESGWHICELGETGLLTVYDETVSRDIFMSRIPRTMVREHREWRKLHPETAAM